MRERLRDLLTSPACTIALGLVLVGLVKALFVIVAGRRIGLPLAALAVISVAWATGPLAAGWLVKRWRDLRRSAAGSAGNAQYAQGAQDAK